MKNPINSSRGRMLFTSVIALLLGHAVHAIPVIPGAQGFGTDTPAGRGGTVLTVTTLADQVSPLLPGSLRWACKTSTNGQPRTIVFEVAGVIQLLGTLAVDERYTTIAGQTAPHPGITLRDYGLVVRASDVLVQHIASRPGAIQSNNVAAFKVATGAGVAVSNVVFDHVSASWSSDEIGGTYGSSYNIENVTWSNSLIAEPVGVVPGPTGTHAPFGTLFAKNSNWISFARNIEALCWYRNPAVQDTIRNAQIVDNFIYRPGMRAEDAIYIGNHNDPTGGTGLSLAVSAVGNVIMRHPAPVTVNVNGTPATYNNVNRTGFYVKSTATTALSVFLNDNRLYDPTGSGSWHPPIGDPYNTVFYNENLTPDPTKLGSDPHAAGLGVVSLNQTGVVSADITQLEATLKLTAGKFPAMRDSYDAGLISKIEARTGKWNEGWSQITAAYGSNPWVLMQSTSTRTLTLPSNPSDDTSVTIDVNGVNYTTVAGNTYTNMEEYLHRWAAVVEGTDALDPETVKTDDFTDGDTVGWTPASGTWGIHSDGGNNGYRQTSTTGGAVTTFGGTNWTDYAIEAKVKVNSFTSGGDSLASVFARHQDATNYYTFMVVADSSGVTSVALKKRAGSVTTLASTAYTVNTGTQYTLKLKAVGNVLTGFVNGAQVLTATDSSSPIASGRASLNTYRANATFDDVVATPDGMGLAAPGSLTATAIDYNRTDLSWTDVAGENGYKIERKKGSGGAYVQIDTKGANVVSYSDTTCGTGTQYYYRVRAYDGSGDGPFSAEASDTTPEIAGRQAHWKFNESSGTTANDETGNNNDVTLSSGASFAGGQIGNAIALNGTTGNATDASTTGLNLSSALTICAWVNADSLPSGYSTVVAKGNQSLGRGYALNVKNGYLNMAKVGNPTGATLSTVALPTGAYHHVAISWDAGAGQVKFYLDGSLAQTVSNSVAVGTALDSDPVVIGSWLTGGSWMDGAIDDLRIYDSVLSLAQVQAIREAGL